VNWEFFYVSVVVYVCAVQLIIFGRKFFTEFKGTKRKEPEKEKNHISLFDEK